MDSQQTYEEKYASNYGVKYPEGHIIRFYEHLLKHEYAICGASKEKLLDFGCGNGTHTAYFAEKGFDVIGLDIIPSAIESARQRFSQLESKFRTMNRGQNLSEVVDDTYDVILCNQVLYYMSDSDLDHTLKQLANCLKSGGLIYITMMSTLNYYWNYSSPLENGLHEVNLSGRLEETSYINFMRSEDHVRRTFDAFECEFLGYYDISIREGSSHHYQFLGRKK